MDEDDSERPDQPYQGEDDDGETDSRGGGSGDDGGRNSSTCDDLNEDYYTILNVSRDVCILATLPHVLCLRQVQTFPFLLKSA